MSEDGMKVRQNKEVAGEAGFHNACMAFCLGETSIRNLMIIGGCSDNTLHRSWMPRFKEYKKRLMLGFRNSAFVSEVTDEMVEKHERTVKTLANEKLTLERELEHFEELAVLAKKIVRQVEVAGGDPDDLKQAMDLLKMFTDTRKLKSTLTRSYIEVSREWRVTSGLQGAIDNQKAYKGETVKMKAKDDYEESKNSSLRDANGSGKSTDLTKEEDIFGTE